MTRRCTKGAGPPRPDPLSVSSLLELVLETGGNLGRLVLGDLNDLLDVLFADRFLGLLEALFSLLLQIFQTHVSSLEKTARMFRADAIILGVCARECAVNGWGAKPMASISGDTSVMQHSKRRERPAER